MMGSVGLNCKGDRVGQIKTEPVYRGTYRVIQVGPDYLVGMCTVMIIATSEQEKERL